MSMLKMFHICMELWGIIFCAIATIGLIVGSRRMATRKSQQIIMQALCVLLLAADMTGWYFDGRPGRFAEDAVRAGDMAVYCVNYLYLSIFTLYVWQIVRKNGEKAPWGLYATFATSAVSIVLMVISQFNGMYYYFDADNVYHRGTYYIFTQVLAFIGMAISFSMLYQYRNRVSKSIYYALIAYFVLPIITTIAQTFLYGFSLQSISVVISTQVMFVVDNLEMARKFQQQEIAYQKASFAAEHDTMTGLWNKSSGLQRINEHLNSMDTDDEALLMFVDIDDFKHVNDTYGHSDGDFWIRQVADTLRNIYRPNDVICRFGGDEFVALIKGTSSTSVIRTTLGLFSRRMRETSVQRGQDVHCSVGICRVAAGGYRSPEHIVSTADKALYEAKRNGKHAYVVYDSDGSRMELAQ